MKIGCTTPTVLGVAEIGAEVKFATQPLPTWWPTRELLGYIPDPILGMLKVEMEQKAAA